jgi:DNA-binding response OmpR family regulator
MHSHNGLNYAPTILVVDADPGTCKYMAVILAMQGFQVLQANDSLEAIITAASKESKLDLLLTEMDMPRISGAQLAECLRGVVSDDLKVLYTTQNAGARLRDGGVPILFKPFDPADLVGRTEEALKTPVASLAR